MMKKAARAHRTAVTEANWQEWISEGGAAQWVAPTNGQRHAEHADIARLAYALWEQRGRPDGSSEEDWLRAERELAGKNSR